MASLAKIELKLRINRINICLSHAKGCSSIKSGFATSRASSSKGRSWICRWTERREPGESASVVQDLFRSLVVRVRVAVVVAAGNHACRNLCRVLALNEVLCHAVLDRVVVEAVSRRNWLRVEVTGHLHIKGDLVDAGRSCCRFIIYITIPYHARAPVSGLAS